MAIRNCRAMLLLLVACLQAPALAQPAAVRTTLVFSSAHAPPVSTPARDGFDERVIREIFARLGYAVAFRQVTARRSLVELNQGIDDGTLPRTRGLQREFPNIVPLDEPVREITLVAFVKRDDIRVAGWESLAPYHVAYVTGWKIVERNVAAARSVTSAPTVAQMLRLVDVGRVDLGIVSLIRGVSVQRKAGLTSLRPIGPPLARRDLYVYLNRCHLLLVEPAGAALRAIKADGTWQALHDLTIGAFFAQ